VRLVERWNRVESSLDPRWTEATLSLEVYDDRGRARAAALLAPTGPGLAGKAIRFHISTRGAGVGPEGIRRLLRLIDDEGIAGRLELVTSSGAKPEPEPPARSLAAAWQETMAALPADWSDLLCELELDSSTDVDRAAVLCAPLNPARSTAESGFRFRCASARGYGASAGMAARCLARLDENEIRGRVRITRVLSDVHPVGTQGALFLTGRRPA
jgi:hypothetical protein